MSGSDFDPSNPQDAAPLGDVSSPPALVGIVDAVPGGELSPRLEVAATVPAAPPGPGLLESFGWTALVLAAQVGMLMVLLTVVFAYLMVQHGGRLPPNAFDIRTLKPDAFALVNGLPGFLAYLVLIPLACWRIGPSPLRKLNFSRPSATQLVIVCSCVLPLGYVSDALYTLQKDHWEQFLDLYPELDWLREIGLYSMMAQLRGASLPLLLFLLAVVPAVGEEWMLRGLIGRGLVARWGVFTGVLFTSILFAAMHLDPPHAAAVFPLGVMMHVSYLATRSFWMPIAYHFLNNAVVSVFTSLGEVSVEGGTQEHSWLPPLVAIPYLAFAIAALWKIRTRYLGPDGREPGLGYFSFEHYPETQARRVAPNHLLLGVVFGTLLAGQVACEVWWAGGERASSEQVSAASGDNSRPPLLDRVETAPTE